MSTPASTKIINELRAYAENSDAEMDDMIAAFAHMYFSSLQMKLIYDSDKGLIPRPNPAILDIRVQQHLAAYLRVNPFPVHRKESSRWA